jgi:gluconolactonase
MVSFELLAEGLEFPEGPVVTPRGTLVVMEVMGGRLTEIDPVSGDRETFADCGGGPAAAAFGPDGALYVCNFRGAAVQRVDVVTREVSSLYTECDGEPLGSPNDLVFDAAGGFWFTDTSLDALFYATPDGASIRRRAEGLPDANGIALSPDGTTLYVVTSADGRLQSWDVTAPGEIARSGAEPSDAKILWDFGVAPIGETRPSFDGMAIERDGNICIGLLHDGAVGVFSPSGEYLERHPVPEYDWAVTNICFSGPELRTVFVTCGDTGRVYRAEWPRPGLGLAR